ncbi:hypothetical protein DVA67_011525 [Solirubrobacter sp. CPCC 204708]|uniref:Flp pilus-assembly TadG-like N-terminal domain-containing protein n=1 Tax=Solirubrobacter deserti TaxID=2282478 RepID=A0ABT4RPQ4_9ACTN|nr:hypothetical protein [Solirubrobacter deserti]MBE2316609.1 hypothetical protein [Solirubrobacter deserti]MDA0140507.1 hypothetical protein [Solirubrobacter deserti]
MILTVMAMFIISMFVAASYVAVTGDMRLSAIAQDRKASQSGAEAGADYYLNRLRQDPDFWTKCDTLGPLDSTDPTKNPINQLWDGEGPDPRVWRSLPNSSEEYTIELIPAAGYDECIPNKQESFIDLETGTFRIKITARSRKGDPRPRTLIVTYARDSFLNYIYFTDYENLDPAAFASATDRAKQTTNCANRYRSARAGKGCAEIQFATGDSINGPLHTNDENLFICGSPVFGRTKNQDGSSRATLTDTVEVSGPPEGYVANPNGSGCANTPVIQTAGGQRKFVTRAKRLMLPSSNSELATYAANSGNLYTGVTSIRLRGTVMDVTNNGTTTTKTWPTNGVLYVKNGNSCEPEFPTAADYNEPASCGNVYVSGTYSRPLTIAAANDVIIRPTSSTSPTDANITQVGTDSATLGLIANNFVRVSHRVASDCKSNLSPVLNNVTIEAAILALQHSFIVDNHNCGPALSKLTVNGAIVQKYRGPVGTGSGASIATGYAKNYWYDDRFRFRSPPYFLVPDESAWNPVRTHEVVG